MKRITLLATLFFTIAVLLNGQSTPQTTQGVSLLDNSDTETKIQELIEQMTLKEKAGQMLMLGLPAMFTGGYWDARDKVIWDAAKFHEYIVENAVGSIHNTPGYPAERDEWYSIIKTIQDSIMQKSRLGIPTLYGIDNIHGANYVMGSVIFPHQIAMAATWNPELTKQSAAITSYESRAASLPYNFNPNADIAPEPLWGRISESFGEDPFLISTMTNAYIQGSQEKGLNDSTSSAICVKHFLGYGAGRNGKDRANATIPENSMRQYYLPPFQEAINSGAMSIMISSNSVNGIPCHSNSYYVNDLLKGELGFRGVVVSDFVDVDQLTYSHNVASDKRMATKLAVNAGLDLFMDPFNADIIDIIVDLVENNEIEMSRIDDAVTRILRLKFHLNLFEVPYNNPNGYTDFGSKESIEVNYKSASEAITLLKNTDKLLPLSREAKVLVTGYTANSINLLNGAWSRSFLGRDTRFNDPSKLTILDAITEEVGIDNIEYIEGTDYLEDINSDKAIEKAENVDYIVLCVGEITASEKPSDINELPLPKVQQELVKKLSKTGKPIILVMVQGRPRIIREVEPLADAILMAYYPGQEGGRAISDILYGKVNPSGKLPYTYPMYTGNTITYYHKNTDIRAADWSFNGFYPQFEFGFGLSYTNYEYSNLTLSADTISNQQTIHISVDVTNSGERAGKEVVEVFLKDLIATVSPDSKKLVRFEKIELQSGETKTLEFKLNTKDLSYIGLQNTWIVEEGDFEVQVGGKPQELLTKGFYYKE